MRPETAKTLAGLPAPDQVVTVDPDKLLRLSVALGQTADRVSTVVGAVEAALAEIGAAAEPLGPMLGFASWARAEQAGLRAVARTVLEWEASGGRPPVGWHVVHAAPLVEFATPGPAVDAASAALVAAAGHDHQTLGDLLARWASNAVFAAELVRGLGPAGLAAEAHWLAMLLGAGLDDERRTAEAVVSGLGTAWAIARRTGGSNLGVADVVADRGEAEAGEVALLLATPTPFDADLLVEATRVLVVAPIGVAANDGDWVAPQLVEGERYRRDSTGLVTQALARNPEACTRALLELDLSRMLGAPTLDGGRRLGDVLDRGTDPRLTPDAPLAAARLIHWVADRVELDGGELRRHPKLEPDTQAALGRVAAHYIGSFRSDTHDLVTVDPIADQLRGVLAGDEARRFLSYAARQQAAADAMRAALIRWSVAGVGAVARHPTDLAVFSAIGDVGRLVSDAVEQARVAWAATVDEVRESERRLWSLVMVEVNSVLDPFDPASRLASWASLALEDVWLPAGRSELNASLRQPRELSADQLRLESAAASVLWAGRADNHLFDGAPPPPELLDGDRLRTLDEVDADDTIERFSAWLARVGESGTDQLDRLGAEFGAAGTRPDG